MEITEINKLKGIIKYYYEEIEYLTVELGKLRELIFLLFFQKPDIVIKHFIKTLK